MADNDREEKRKRRKARAALVILRRNISTVCGKAMNAADFYDKVAAYTAPVMSEFSDALPSESRGHMDKLMELITERREEASTACHLCKGEVDAAIKGVAAQLGVQGAILSALRPIENVAPEWVVDGPLAEVAVALGVVLVGGSLVAGIAVLASGGGTEEGSSAANLPSSTPVGVENGTDPEATGSQVDALVLASACDVVTPDDAAGYLGGPTQVNSSGDTTTSSCEYLALPGNGGNCDELRVTLYSDEPPGWADAPEFASVGDESRRTSETSLVVRKGNVWGEFEVTCSGAAIPIELALAVATQAESQDWEVSTTPGIEAGT